MIGNSVIKELNQYFTLRNIVHILCNHTPPVRETDKLWTVKPLVEAVRHLCNEIILKERMDVQMIPFTDQISAKNFINKNKPNPVGIKKI